MKFNQIQNPNKDLLKNFIDSFDPNRWSLFSIISRFLHHSLIGEKEEKQLS